MSWQVLFLQREMRISWWLCNNSEIHLWLWKVWSLVVCSQSFLLMLQEHVRATIIDETRFLFAKKQMNLLPNTQLLIIVPFQSNKCRKKELCVDNKVQKAIGDMHCPTCRNEKCVYISTNKTTSFYDCKKCKACCHVRNIPFKDQKPTILVFSGDGTNCFARKTSGDYEKEKPSQSLRTFFCQSQPSTTEPDPKKIKVFPFLA